jgi:hypothetical protein
VHIFTSHYSIASGEPHPKVIPLDDGGVVGVFSFLRQISPYNLDVHAKRVNPDGTLGGPLHLLTDLTPQNPPIQIPASGGNFTFNAAITDTYVVNSHFDAWIELTSPDGRKSDVTLRRNVQIDSNSSLSRFDLQQNVPASAPAGTYIYTLYVGSHEYHIPWSQDGFTFEKVAGGSLLVAGKGDACIALTQESSDWTFSGDFFGDQQGVQLNAPTQSTSDDLKLDAHPNPFNPTTTFTFTLPEAARVTFEVFDITGCRVGVGLDPTRLDAGPHAITFDGSDLPSGIYLYRMTSSGSGPTGMASQTTPTMATGKMVLLK